MPVIAVTLISPCDAQIVADPRAGQEYSQSAADPSEVFLKAFTSVQQGEKLEEDGRLRPALAKYRFAASLLEQLGQTNPNWQPLIVRYRIRKTTENIRKLEDKINVQPPAETPQADSGHPVVPAGQSPGVSDEDDLPVPDAPVAADGHAAALAPAAAPVEALNRTTMELGAKLNQSQQSLKAAQDALTTAKKDREDAIKQKQDLQVQLHKYETSSNIVNRRLERIKNDRDDLQKQLDTSLARLNDLKSKNPKAAESRKELSEQVATLKKSLAKAEDDAKAAQQERDLVNQKLTESEGRNAKIIEERDKAVAYSETFKDAAEKIQSLQTENDALNKKLADAEASITKLTAEAVQKKEELDGMRSELTKVKDQLATTRDQQDRSETTITELRQKLDEDTKQLAELKAKGMTGEDYARMTNENDLLRGIVMRQLKVDAGRALARKLVSDELARLEVQSNVLNEQMEQLSKPTVQLTDEERALFKDPQITVAATENPSTLAATITAIRPKNPGDSAPSTATGADGGSTPSAAATPSSDTAAAAANTPPDAGGAPQTASTDTTPKVETEFKPKVSEDLQPLAKQAKESFDRGHYPEAEETYKKLLARDPKNIYLLYNQGVVLSRQNKLKSAEVTLKRAVSIDPKDAYSLSTLGIVYYRMHRYDDALECLTKSVQLDPKNATAHNYLGITSSQKGWPEAALEELQKAIALNPNYADAQFNIAVIYATSQPPDKDQAREHYKAAVSLGAAPDAGLEKILAKK